MMHRNMGSKSYSDIKMLLNQILKQTRKIMPIKAKAKKTDGQTNIDKYCEIAHTILQNVFYMYTL